MSIRNILSQSLSKPRRFYFLVILKVRNAPYHNKFLPPARKIELVDDGDIVRKHRTTSSVDKEFIRNKEDNSTEKLGNK